MYQVLLESGKVMELRVIRQSEIKVLQMKIKRKVKLSSYIAVLSVALKALKALAALAILKSTPSAQSTQKYSKSQFRLIPDSQEPPS